MIFGMKRIVVVVVVLGLLVPLAIAIVGYCLDPNSTGLETILLGGSLLLSSLAAMLFLKSKPENTS